MADGQSEHVHRHSSHGNGLFLGQFRARTDSELHLLGLCRHPSDWWLAGDSIRPETQLCRLMTVMTFGLQSESCLRFCVKVANECYFSL